MDPRLKDSCNQPDKICSGANTSTQADTSFSRTTDVELGADWQPNEKWQVHASADLIYSRYAYKTLNVTGTAVMPAYGVDLTGNYPKFIFSDIATLRTGSNYYWANTMPNTQRNGGQEIQANLDVVYHLDHGFLKDIKFGWRGDVRTEQDRQTDFDWEVLGADWNPPKYYWSDAKSAADTRLFQFPNFFRGEANLPGPALFVDASKAEMLSDTYFQERYNCKHNGDIANCPTQTPFTPRPLQAPKHFKTVNVAAYAMATFAKDDVFGMPLSGNVGARLVYVDNQASAHYSAQGSTTFRFAADGPLWATDLQDAAIVGGRVSWTLLPAFNVQIMPTDQIHVRLAGSVTAQQPGFGNITANYTVSTRSITNPAWDAQSNSSVPKTLNMISAWNFQGDSPRIKPEIGRNLDLSVEWYGQGAEAHAAAFYKSIKHKVVDSLEMQNRAWDIGMPDVTNPTDGSCKDSPCQFSNGYQTVIEPTAVHSNVNSNKEAVIRGFEFGFTKYFDWDFVPSSLKGFGLTGNYTYIDSRASGAYSLDMFGTNIAKRLPIENLSHHAFNAALMYDRNPISFRLAYNWRSKYLLMASGWDTHPGNGIGYRGADVGVTCHLNNTAAAGVGGNVVEDYCNYALPIWSKSFGSLDAGMDYSIDENWKISIQSQNLLNTKAKTTVGINMPAYVDGTGVARPAQREMPRNWFTADRRVSIDLRVDF
jgi:TonB-dependent receptor